MRLRRRILSIPEQYKLKIARKTLLMNDIAIEVIGGQTKEEAKSEIKRLTKKSRRDES